MSRPLVSDEVSCEMAVRERERAAQAFKLSNSGLGTMRSAGTYIGALLQLESDHWYAVAVLVEAAKKVGISKEQIIDAFDQVTCTHCGMSDSPLRPCECHEVRP